MANQVENKLNSSDNGLNSKRKKLKIQHLVNISYNGEPRGSLREESQELMSIIDRILGKGAIPIIEIETVETKIPEDKKPYRCKIGFRVTKLIDPIKSGSSLEVGKVFEGEYIPYRSLNGSISYTDTNGTDWLFYPGQTCEILPHSNIL